MGRLDAQEYGMVMWRLALSTLVGALGVFEMVLEFGTLVHNFASHFDAGSASRASALNAHLP